MRTNKVTMYVLALATGFLFMVSSCSKESNLNNEVNTTEGALKASGPSANGQGGLLLEDRVQHFSFHAKQDKDGNVSGSWETHSPGQDLRTHGTIDCFFVLDDGITAVMSGIVTHVGGEGFPDLEVGDPVYFKVQDNGEGSGSDSDTFSDWWWLDQSYCQDFNFPMMAITNGNIQVKP